MSSSSEPEVETGGKTLLTAIETNPKVADPYFSLGHLEMQAEFRKAHLRDRKQALRDFFQIRKRPHKDSDKSYVSQPSENENNR